MYIAIIATSASMGAPTVVGKLEIRGETEEALDREIARYYQECVRLARQRHEDFVETARIYDLDHASFVAPAPDEVLWRGPIEGRPNYIAVPWMG